MNRISHYSISVLLPETTLNASDSSSSASLYTAPTEENEHALAMKAIKKTIEIISHELHRTTAF